MNVTPITDPVEWMASNVERARGHLTTYFQTHRGRFFEVFLAESRPGAFDPWSILAVSALSVTPPADAIAEIIQNPGPLSELVGECEKALSSSVDPWERTRIVRDSACFADLYKELKAIERVGHVTASKLLASKFPDVVPIRDSKVEKLLGLTKEWWAPMHHTLLRVLENWPDIDAQTSPIGFESGGAPTVAPTALRRIDVVLWMEAKSRGL